MNNKKHASYLMLLSSMLIFGTIGIFRRYIPLSSGLLACIRGFLGSISLLVFLKIKKKPVFTGFSGKQFLWLALSGAFIGINWILLFEAYNNTTIAVATLCYYMEPTIVILLSPLIFKEKLTVRKLACAIISLAGMFFVSGLFDTKGGSASSLSGVLLGLGAAAFYSAVVIMNKMVKVDNVYQKTVIQLSSAAIVILPYLIITERGNHYEFTASSIIMIILVGVVHTGLAYALYFGSIAALNAQSVAVMSYIDPVSALILSALILGEKMSIFGTIGAVLIIGSALVSEKNS